MPLLGGCPRIAGWELHYHKNELMFVPAFCRCLVFRLARRWLVFSKVRIISGLASAPGLKSEVERPHEGNLRHLAKHWLGALLVALHSSRR